MDKAELNAYSRGYQAGKRRRQNERKTANNKAQHKAFVERCFIALLPAAMQVDGWTVGSKKISTGEERVMLARLWANQAAVERYNLK